MPQGILGLLLPHQNCTQPQQHRRLQDNPTCHFCTANTPTSGLFSSYGTTMFSANATIAPTQNPVSRISSVAVRTLIRLELAPGPGSGHSAFLDHCGTMLTPMPKARAHDTMKRLRRLKPSPSIRICRGDNKHVCSLIWAVTGKTETAPHCLNLVGVQALVMSLLLLP